MANFQQILGASQFLKGMDDAAVGKTDQIMNAILYG